MSTVCMNTSLLILQLPLIIYFQQEDCNERTEHRSLYRNRSEEAATTESQKTEDSLKLSSRKEINRRYLNRNIVYYSICISISIKTVKLPRG